MIIVKSQLKELAEGMSVSNNFAETLDKEVTNIIKKAIKRAKANGRRTVMSKDI